MDTVECLICCLCFIQNAGSSSVISHPCYHVGYNINVTLDDLYNSPCVDKPNNFNPTATILFSGTGNSSLCLSVMEKIINFTDCGFSSECGFNGAYQPHVNGEFFVSVSYFIKSFLFITSSIRFQLEKKSLALDFSQMKIEREMHLNKKLFLYVFYMAQCGHGKTQTMQQNVIYIASFPDTP